MPAFSAETLLTVFRYSIECLRRLRVDYSVIGAWALSVWGRPRATQDLDFLLMVNEEQLDQVGGLLTEAGMELDETWLKWNPMLRGYQLRLRYEGFTIDLLRPRDSHDRGVFRRRRRKKLEGIYYWVIGPEDLVLQKLKVGRPRDFEDALSVLERCRKQLDLAYLHRWSRRLGVHGELNHVLAILHA